MITITERAKEVLKATLIATEADPDEGLRLLPTPDGRFVLTLDTELPGDQVVEHEGAKVLLVAPELAPVVDGVTLEVQDTPDGPKLVVSKE